MPSREINEQSELAHAEHRARQLISEAQGEDYKYVVIPDQPEAQADVRRFSFYKEKGDADSFVNAIKEQNVTLSVVPISSDRLYKTLTIFCKHNLDFNFKISPQGHLQPDMSK